MQQREEYPAGVPCFIDSGRKDPEAPIAFYGGLFGWEFEDVSPPGAPSYFTAKLHGLVVAALGVQPDMDWAPVWNTYVRVDDADAAATGVTEAGGTVTIEPFAVGPAGRMVAFDDPEGAALCAWEPGQTRGAQQATSPARGSSAPCTPATPTAPGPSTAPSSDGGWARPTTMAARW